MLPSHPRGGFSPFLFQYPDLESNQDLDLRRVRCDPLHHRDIFSLVPKLPLEGLREFLRRRGR